MVNSRKPVFGSNKSKLLKKAKSRKLAQRIRQFESLERREMMAADFPQNVQAILNTMLFKDQASYQRMGHYLQSQLSGGGGSGSSGGGAAAEGTAPLNTSEAEPNNTRATANFLPLGNLGGQNPVVNVTGTMQTRVDEDYFAFDLKKGDIFDVRINALVGQTPSLVLYSGTGAELLYSNQVFYPPANAQTITPSKSPRFQDGAATLSYVIDTDARYYLRVSEAAGAYSLNLRTYRPTIEQEPIGTKQVLFLDFDGAFFRNEVLHLDAFAGVSQEVRVAPFDRVLPLLGLTAADAPAVARNITTRLERIIRTQLAADTNNGFYANTGNAGDFDIQIVNSFESADLWGQKNVSRILIGGSQADFGVPADSGLLGIAQSIDIGNFDREESALVMTDLLAAISLTIPRAGNVPLVDAFAESVARVIAHEGGHILGGMHQDPASAITTVMDAFFDPSITYGRDGLFGSPDDELSRYRFINDDFRPGETTFGGGVNNSGQILAFGMSTGKVGASIIGTVYNDLNRNAQQGSGEPGIAGWEVFADINNNGLRDSGEPRTTSDSAGKYTLRVAPGTYNVRVNRAASWVPSTASETFKTVTVATNATATANFGSVLPSDVATGFKWLDINGNGIRDAGEPPLAGVYIYLDLDGDDRPDLGEPASVTKADGSYSLTPPGPGTYAIREVVEAGYIQTFPAAGEHTVVYDGVNPLRGYDFGNTESSDWGDAPAPYPTTRAAGGASHGTTPGLRLGANFDADQDGQPSSNADGDNNNGLLNGNGTVINDEDGVTLLTPIVRGDSSNIFRVNVTNTTGTPAYLQAWLDFNGDGDWNDAGEQIATNVLTVAGNNDITFTTPSSSVARVYARFRLSQDRDLGPGGRSKTGEVEDYVYTVVDGPRVLLQPDTFSVARNSSNNAFDVLANDFVLPGTSWTITGVSSGSQNGRAFISADGKSLTYTPRFGFSGRETFTYTARNTSGVTETTTVTVNVILQFNDPVAVDDSFDVPTNSIGYPLSVLANDIEGRNGALTVVEVGTPDKGGSVTIGSGGQSIRYTPRRGFGGTEVFTYTVEDASFKRSTATVTVHTISGDRLDDEVEFSFAFFNTAGEPITAVRQGDAFKVAVYVDDLRPEKAAQETPPRVVIDPGVYSAYLDILYSTGLVTPNAPLSGSSLNFAATFTPPYVVGRNGDASIPGIINEFGAYIGAVTEFSQPGKLQVAVLDFTASSAGIAEFVGDPADLFPGSEVTFYNTPTTRVPVEQIRYGRSSLEIVPNGVNFPFAVDDTRFNVPVGIPYNVDVMTNDITGTQPPIRITSVTQPANGQTQINNNNTPSNFADDTVTYLPNTNFTGVDQFTYTITDDRGFVSTATVTLHVGPQPTDLVTFRLGVFKNIAGAGQPANYVEVDELQVGDEFQLRGYVQDKRVNPRVAGVFAAFQDVLYNSGLVSVKTAANPQGFDVVYSTLYSNAVSGDIRIPGLINELGSIQTNTTSPTGATELLQFTVNMRANAVGVASFIGDPADIKPFHDSFAFDPTTPLTPAEINYISDSVRIVANGSGSGGGEGNTNLTNPYDVNNDGFVSPIDVLILVNSLNNSGSGPLGGSGEGGSDRYYLDVNGDNYLSPLDALMVINELNTRSSGGSGEGEGEGTAAAPTVTVNNQVVQTPVVEVPFAVKRSGSQSFVYGPAPLPEDIEKLFGSGEAVSDDIDEADYLDGLAEDLLRCHLA